MSIWFPLPLRRSMRLTGKVLQTWLLIQKDQSFHLLSPGLLIFPTHGSRLFFTPMFWKGRQAVIRRLSNILTLLTPQEHPLEPHHQLEPFCLALSQLLITCRCSRSSIPVGDYRRQHGFLAAVLPEQEKKLPWSSGEGLINPSKARTFTHVANLESWACNMTLRSGCSDAEHSSWNQRFCSLWTWCPSRDL